MIFRWSIWGGGLSRNLELLRYSILSFKKQFGSEHQYVVYTDDANFVAAQLNKAAHVQSFPDVGQSPFCIESKATWRKWCPSPRLDVNKTEIYVDSDVFLLKYPEEIASFIADSKTKFAVLDEFLGEPWQHGAMQKRATANTPLINAGLFIQKAGYDITHDLLGELNWWQSNILTDEQTHHDEQGALRLALAKYAAAGELCILPKNRYLIIGENENTEIENLEAIILFHAVYPEHPAFYKFKHILDRLVMNCK